MAERIERIMVRAREGLSVPMENSKRRIGPTAVPVTLTTYYRRQIADGDLVQVHGAEGETP